MELIADTLLVAGALGAGFYCFILARRLNRFTDLEKGVGGAVAVLSSQVDDLNKTLGVAKSASEGSNDALVELTTRAEVVAQKLELMMASMHDVPEQKAPDQEVPDQEIAEAVSNADEDGSPSRSVNGPMFVRHGRGHSQVPQ